MNSVIRYYPVILKSNFENEVYNKTLEDHTLSLPLNASEGSVTLELFSKNNLNSSSLQDAIRIEVPVGRVETCRTGKLGISLHYQDNEDDDNAHSDLMEIDQKSIVSSRSMRDYKNILLILPNETDRQTCYCRLYKLLKSDSSINNFDQRTKEWSAVQYFQFYSYLSQQQNMMQDYTRTSTYQQAVLQNIADFRDKVVLDVGAGSGILSFFAVQAGAKRVYAVEASNMAVHCETLVRNNNMSHKIIVLSGKVEEVTIDEPIDVVISEPMGYMLLNERMLESYIHARKFLRQENGISKGLMFPTVGQLYICPFSDEMLYMEQCTKANFWFQQNFYGVDLTRLREAAVREYFYQPVVDTFDISICLAKPHCYTIDFSTAEEEDLANIDIPLRFVTHSSGTIHGYAFWFDVGFLGSTKPVWLSTAPMEPLTHWYQVRCLFETPVYVQENQTLVGRVILKSNERQSYDVDIELNIPGSTGKVSNKLDLKNPYFRYTFPAIVQQQTTKPTNNGSDMNNGYSQGQKSNDIITYPGLSGDMIGSSDQNSVWPSGDSFNNGYSVYNPMQCGTSTSNPMNTIPSSSTSSSPYTGVIQPIIVSSMTTCPVQHISPRYTPETH